LRIVWKDEEGEAEDDAIAEVWDMVVILISWEGVVLMGS
jgi:hypothetical protein